MMGGGGERLTWYVHILAPEIYKNDNYPVNCKSKSNKHNDCLNYFMCAHIMYM